ncbi:DUF1997 domain-containing protein [Altericista sp. CCNU0014]|uniref:DUF1997 domain-containing protein n=1 Tax=Altericista sp. CCNU0014 TaxID=3082949 RepID=UPI00384F02F7
MLGKAMQSDYAQSLSHDNWMDLTEEPSAQTESTSKGLMHFHSHFVGAMELKADAETVEQYLNIHRGWFCRCAHPMAVEPVGENGYLLTIGRYGSFGFEVEPKIGLHLLPPDEQGIYRIETIPDVTPEDNGYKVDFRAALELVDRATDRSQQPDASQSSPPQNSTHIEWTLDLNVALLFPKFIRRLPHNLIQGTGDRLLAQIVRQVSRRLTAKVQDDFHASLNR